jgi:catechol 2,3-dioxygenase-like lactoylglutathione lyase family enzyme
MSRYVDSTEHLVTEIIVSDIRRSTACYRRLGFARLCDGCGLVELIWEAHPLFLDERSAGPEGDQAALSAPRQFPPANIRVMMPHVDGYWRLAQDLGARIVVPFADRSYGRRDCTIAAPTASASAWPVSWRRGSRRVAPDSALRRG